MPKWNKIIDTNPGFDWYITLNPTRARACPPKARSLDVLEWAWILLDVDPVSPDADPKSAIDFILDTHDLHDYCVILDSGRGRQAWVSLKPMSLSDVSSGDGGRSQVERATSAWLRSLDPFKYGCRVDTSCSDLARVARCPGTVNSKTGRTAQIISMPRTQLDPQEVLKHAPEPIVPAPIEQGMERGLAGLLPRLSETAARFLTEGIITPGRHSACYAAARSLCESSMVYEAAKVHLLAAGNLCRPVLSARDVERTARMAFEKGPHEYPHTR